MLFCVRSAAWLKSIRTLALSVVFLVNPSGSNLFVFDRFLYLIFEVIASTSLVAATQRGERSFDPVHKFTFDIAGDFFCGLETAFHTVMNVSDKT